IPGVPARGEHHHLRLETGRIVEAADIDADHVGLGDRLVVDRRAAGAAEAFQLVGTGVGGPRDLGYRAGDVQCSAREHHHRRMPRARVPLAVAALTLEASKRLGGDVVADGAAGTTAGVRAHTNLLVETCDL